MDERAQALPEWLHHLEQAARLLGIEIDLDEARRWREALEAASNQPLVQHDAGFYGHPAAMLDFAPERLAYLREIASLVALPARTGQVETALALSGSAAQSSIQTHPGDVDFFQRVNLRTPSLEEAKNLLAHLLRTKALETLHGPTYQLIEVKFGSYPFDMVHQEQLHKAGGPISWSPQEIQQGHIEGYRPDGTPVQVTWEQAAHDPGWCKLDWVVVDPLEGRLVNVSNMLDVTWESPEGEIVPLDGFLDPHFQEVYLDPDSLPLFQKLLRHMEPDALEEYVRQLERQVRYYLTQDPNYGKAAKRMYNIFRLTGRYEEAAYLRELFDEPAAALYQVWSLIRTLSDTYQVGFPMSREDLVRQVDRLILQVVRVLEGPEEEDLIEHLLRFRDTLARQPAQETLSQEAEAARQRVLDVVNQYFYRKLTALPSLEAYIVALQQDEPDV